MRFRKPGRGIKKLLPFFLINGIVVAVFLYNWGDILFQTTKVNLALRFYNAVLELYMPQVAAMDHTEVPVCYSDLLSAFLPVYSYSEEIFEYETKAEDQLEYENLAIVENQNMERLLRENTSVVQSMELAEESTQESTETAVVKVEQTTEEAESSTQTTQVLPATDKKMTYSIDQMRDFDYLKKTFYTVDSSTTIGGEQLNADQLLGENLSVDKNAQGPQILIYHTHSLEAYSDSVPGDMAQTVVGVGERLTQILQDKYGWNVMHHTGTYDAVRDYAYSCAAPALQQILTDYPSIQMVIDLHRDGINEDVRLVTEQNGVSMAKVMFFNGLCYSTSTGQLNNYPNPYLQQNLALSFQMKLAADEYYPDYARRIYLKAWRYNMHMCPKSTLIEVGAQTNTLQEALNAMDPLADIIDKVLTQTAQ